MDDEFSSFVSTHVVSILLSVLVVILIIVILAGVAFTVDKVWFATQLIKLLGVAVAKAGTDPGEVVPISDTYLDPFEVIYWNGRPVTFYLDDEVHEASFEAGSEGGCDPLYLDVVAFSESPTYQNTECSEAGACGTWQFMLETWKWMLRELGLDPNIYSRFNRRIAAKAACLYLKTTGSAQAVNVSKAAHRSVFAQVPPVWNSHTGQADFVYDTYHAAKVLAEGGEVIPTGKMRFEFKAEWAQWIAKFLQFVGLWPYEYFVGEPWDDEGLPEISPPFPGVDNICNPVPPEAYITYGFGVRYQVNGVWYVHYGTDFAVPGFAPFPVFALTSGTVSTGHHYTVDGIVVLRPDGIDNTVIKYFHMRESTINGLSGRVECGTPLGIADGGGTISDGPHLHLQIEVNGVRVDPMEWIEQQR